jgi:hypothetical protein
MKSRLIAALIFFVIPGLSYISADVYRWTDGRGTVSYGNLPPADARDLKLIFKESASPPGAGTAPQDEARSDAETTIQKPEEEKNSEEEAQPKAESAKRNIPPSRQEVIAQEKEKLETKIAELEALPLEYFGSQKNKRVRIGYYQNRLDVLKTNPNDYFSNPVPFEGNIKTPEKKQ